MLPRFLFRFSRGNLEENRGHFDKKDFHKHPGTETRGNTVSPLLNYFLCDAHRRLVLHRRIRHLPQVGGCARPQHSVCAARVA